MYYVLKTSFNYLQSIYNEFDDKEMKNELDYGSAKGKHNII